MWILFGLYDLVERCLRSLFIMLTTLYFGYSQLPCMRDICYENDTAST